MEAYLELEWLFILRKMNNPQKYLLVVIVLRIEPVNQKSLQLIAGEKRAHSQRANSFFSPSYLYYLISFLIFN